MQKGISILEGKQEPQYMSEDYMMRSTRTTTDYSPVLCVYVCRRCWFFGPVSQGESDCLFVSNMR